MTDGGPLLDQVSSQALTRLAAERGLTPAVVPAGEDAVPPMKRTWLRYLPYALFAVSLFALAGMALGFAQLSEGGWSASDGVQLALTALLVAGILQQARAMLRSTGMGRWLRRGSKPGPREAPGAEARPPMLDAVSAESLLELGLATLPRARVTAVARRKGGDWLERTAIVAVVALSVLAFLGMVFLCAYIAYEAGVSEPALWLTVPFAALTGFGTYQVFGSAQRAGFRGRPWSLVTHAFRDSVRVWGSGSLATHVLLTSTAAASVAGTALIPAFTGTAAPYDLFVIDEESGILYRIDLATLTSMKLGANPPGFRSLGLGATVRASKLPDGATLPAGTLLSIQERARDGQQAVVAFRPGSREPIPLSPISPPLPGASFTGGDGSLAALQPDGALWRIDPLSGAATRAGHLDALPGPIVFDRVSGLLDVLSGASLLRIDPRTAKVERTTPLPSSLGGGFRACGVARTGPGELLISEAGTGRIFLVNIDQGSVLSVTPEGDAPARACLMTVALRK